MVFTFVDLQGFKQCDSCDPSSRDLHGTLLPLGKYKYFSLVTSFKDLAAQKGITLYFCLISW